MSDQDEARDEAFVALARSHGISPQAYRLVDEALHYVMEQKGAGRQPVEADELVSGLLVYAVAQFGFLAFAVLRFNNLATPQEVGQRVFEMVRAKILDTSSEDTQADFDLDIDFWRTTGVFFWDKFLGEQAS
jgi:uncharacterized repeat protein (TIGR04138 family)